jgi:hypothetical protein
VRESVLLFTVLAVSACAHQAPALSAPPAPLPTMSVQRELERKVGYAGEPGTMDFVELSSEAQTRAHTVDAATRTAWSESAPQEP